MERARVLTNSLADQVRVGSAKKVVEFGVHVPRERREEVEEAEPQAASVAPVAQQAVDDQACKEHPADPGEG